MRLKDKSLHFIVNFLLGSAWAFLFIGAFSAFFSLYSDNFFYAIVYACIGALPGMISILLLEYIITSKEKHEELIKQTKLLQQLVDKKSE